MTSFLLLDVGAFLTATEESSDVDVFVVKEEEDEFAIEIAEVGVIRWRYGGESVTNLFANLDNVEVIVKSKYLLIGQ